MTGLRQYRPIKVVGSFTCPNGTVAFEGLVRDQDFFALAKPSDDWELEKDGSGNTTRVGNEDNTGELTVMISASDPTNTKLSKLAKLDKALGTGAGVLLVEDLNGDSKIEMRGCFIARIPDLTFGAQRGVRAWRFKAGDADTFAGGHDLA